MPHRSTAAYVAALDPIDLAEAAGIDTPAPGSPGVAFLDAVRVAVAEALALDAVRVDEIAEAVAAAVPIATVTRWEVFVALRLFREDLAAEALGDVDAGDLTDRVGHALLIFAEALASALVAGAEANAEECERWQRVTCGLCGLSWCDRHDPAPAALCHACHGRGYTLAPWEQQ